jgi:oligosaccharide repeat unit polymerase
MDSIVFIQVLFAALVTLILIFVVVRRRTIDIFSPLFLFPLAYVSYLFIGSLSILQDEYKISVRQWAFYLLGLACFSMGCAIPLLKSMIKRRDHGESKRIWDARRLLLTSVIIFSLAATSRLLIYLKSGIPLLSSDIFAVRLSVSEPGYLAEIGMSTEIVFMVSAAGLIVFRKYRLAFAGLLLLSFVLALLTGTRTSLVRQLVPVVVLFHYRVKKIPLRALAIMLLVGFVFIGAMGFLRVYRTWGSAAIEDLQRSNYKPALFWARYVFLDFRHGPEGLARVLEMIPGRHGYQWGRLHVSPLLMPLPGNQPPPGVILKEMAGLEFVGVGMAATILAAQYADFGPVGIMVGMFLVGFVYEHVYLLARRRRHVVYDLIFGAVTITFLLGIRTDYLNFEILWTVVLLAVIHFLAGRREEAPAS